MITSHILTEVDTAAYAFQIREAGGKSLYLSDFSYSDLETARQQASLMVNDINARRADIATQKKNTSNVVELRDRKQRQNVDKAAEIIGDAGLEYVYKTAAFTEDICTRVSFESDLKITEEQRAKLEDAINREFGRVIAIAEDKLADCRDGFIWFMLKYPGEIPPVRKS